MLTRLVVLVAAGVLLSCDGPQTHSVAGNSVFVGGWKGTKTYLNAQGQELATAPDWVFQIVVTGGDSLEFVNGPRASVDASSNIVLSSYSYPPVSGSGLPGGCGPVTDTITDGIGALQLDGSLTLTVNWSSACGGTTISRRTTYVMHRADISAPNFSAL